MVSYFETKRDHTFDATRRRRRSSMTAMMNFTRRPWEHLPRRKSSSSTNHRRTSSTSTGSDLTTYEPVEEQLADSFYAASEHSATSTVISEDRRRSANPDYDWEHDDIADMKADLHKIRLWSPPADSNNKEGDVANEPHENDSAGVGDKGFGTAPPGVHEIDFVERAAPQAAKDDSASGSNEDDVAVHHETINDVEVTHSETVKDAVNEDEPAPKPATLDSNASEAPDTPQLPAGAKIPARTSSSSKAGPLRTKTPQSDKERKAADATSPSSPSPKSKTRPKLALDLPGIPESESGTLRRQRRPPLTMLRQAPSAAGAQQRQVVNVNKSSRPPVSLRRYPAVRSISAPQLGQQSQQPVTPPLASPTEISELVSQRQVKFTNIREEKLRRISSINNDGGSARSSRVFMGRRHASAPVGQPAPPPRKRSGMPPPRPSLSQRLGIGKRRQSFSQAIREYIRAPRRKPSFLFRRSWSVAG